jgi:hypothetical protein
MPSLWLSFRRAAFLFGCSHCSLRLCFFTARCGVVSVLSALCFACCRCSPCVVCMMFWLFLLRLSAQCWVAPHSHRALLERVFVEQMPPTQRAFSFLMPVYLRCCLVPCMLIARSCIVSVDLALRLTCCHCGPCVVCLMFVCRTCYVFVDEVVAL